MDELFKEGANLRFSIKRRLKFPGRLSKIRELSRNFSVVSIKKIKFPEEKSKSDLELKRAIR